MPKLDPNYDPFPFGWDNTFAPRTAGIVLGTNIPTSSITMAPPSSTSEQQGTARAVPGTMTEYVGNTTCISATGIQYPQMAGDD